MSDQTTIYGISDAELDELRCSSQYADPVIKRIQELEARLGDNNLRWEFHEFGGWCAWSSKDPYIWDISVCEDGTFSVRESDAELTDRHETFNTLREAQLWCRLMEIGLSDPSTEGKEHSTDELSHGSGGPDCSQTGEGKDA